MRPLIWSIIATMALYSASLFISDLQSIGTAVARLGGTGWLTILGLSLLNYGLRFIRWQSYLSLFKHHVPVCISLAYYLGGFAFTTTPGKAGELIRSRYLQQHGVSYMHSMAAFFSERVLDLIAMVLLALSAAFTFPDARIPITILATVSIGLLPLLQSNIVYRLLNYLNSRVPSERIQAIGEHFLSLLHSASKLLSSGTLFIGLFLGLLAWAAEAIAFHLILAYLDVTLSPILAVSIYAISVLAGALSLIPGGLGTTEATMGALLMLVGIDPASAIAATIICRLSTLWFAVGIGFMIIIILESHTGKNPGYQAIRSSSIQSSSKHK